MLKDYACNVLYIMFIFQAVLLMKSEELAANSSMSASSDLDLNSDKEMAELIGEALNSEA